MLTCVTPKGAHAGYPQWHYGETARRYLGDGVLEFKNTTSQLVDYTAKDESGTNHVISANSRAELPPGWGTTARSDIGLTTDNGWVEGESFGPIKLAPGENFSVEFGVLEKDFISMFVTCQDGFYQNMQGADVVRGTGPAERYAFANIIHADGTVGQQALQIPARAQGANSKPVERPYNTITGPSLEKRRPATGTSGSADHHSAAWSATQARERSHRAINTRVRGHGVPGRPSGDGRLCRVHPPAAVERRR